ncbi:head-tail adaptor protein [Sphingobium yanoikuyae]|uniref:Head-tail adaptor protein n=1 Tax=Sphingobium yanoikuyae TaxID=13690 RepID=A0A3G2V1Q7_SPHYA|nr:head-tail adaptor protein [Sphingobium yanoikuyae]AYO78321.1 head-tail adaptor protein [Sphingobium yanoikuyae]
MALGSLRAGRRDKRIAIERRAPVTDGYGDESEGWSLFVKAWASIYYGSGSELREAAQRCGVQSASFDLLSNSDTREISILNHRIVADGAVWNITARQDLGRNAGVRLTAVRAVG